MFPGINPRKMQQVMKQMGIQQLEIPALEVIIKTEDKEIVISNPSVSKVNMMGQESFQITGEVQERALSSKAEISEDDISTVMQQADVDRETALKAIQKAQGDLAEAIIQLTQKR